VGDIGTIAKQFLDTHYATTANAAFGPVLRCFAASSTGRTTRSQLLDALGGNQLVLDQLQDIQAVLPVDFWNPNEFTLDPELAWIDSLAI
jgi:hypothetical protein